ncbi:MAG: VPLPA-CTERM sorting domain-containing protein [Candidatus Methylumidiphilus sp.]
MLKTKLAAALTIAALGAASGASASTTMYNTFNANGAANTDGWTRVDGSANVGALQPWLGSAGFNSDPADPRPFNYQGKAHLNWAAQLTGAGDAAEISFTDAAARYGATNTAGPNYVEVDTGGGAWQDNGLNAAGASTGNPTGWKHQTDIGLIRSDTTQWVNLNLETLGNLQDPTFSRFGVTVFNGMDTNTGGSYSHHGAWNNNTNPFTKDNPFYPATKPAGYNGDPNQLTQVVGSRGAGFSDNVDGTPDRAFSFLAEAGQVYSVYLGGFGFARWNTGVDNYKLTITTSTTPVPVPAAVWLFGSALAGVGVFGRRKKSA